MKIDRNNYEAYFIDYLEGNLDETLVNDFIEFIQQNPDLKEELSLFDSVKTPFRGSCFQQKRKIVQRKISMLKKNLITAAIASLEGDLSETEKHEFENYISTTSRKTGGFGAFQQNKTSGR